MTTQFRSNDRGVSPDIVDTYDKLEPSNKTAPAGNRGLTNTCMEVTAVVEPTVSQTIEHQDGAREFLRLSREDLVKATRGRIRSIYLARRYGLTNAQIGAELGITEGAVRALMAHNPDERGEF